MIQLVALLGRTDPIVLLCNRKDLIYIWVFKTRDCSSPKSMWFLWNIFSKGTHMLQCLCGKSLKKNKNPSGKLITIYAYSSVSQRTGFMRACVQRVECLRNSVNLVVTMIDLQSHLCSEWIMQRLLKEGGGWWGGRQLILCCYYIGELRSFFRRGAQHRHTKPPRCITTAPWSSNFLNNACSHPPHLSLSHSQTHTGARWYFRGSHPRTVIYLLFLFLSFFFSGQRDSPLTRLFHPRVDCSSAPPPLLCITTSLLNELYSLCFQRNSRRRQTILSCLSLYWCRPILIMRALRKRDFYTSTWVALMLTKPGSWDASRACRKGLGSAAPKQILHLSSRHRFDLDCALFSGTKK